MKSARSFVRMTAVVSSMALMAGFVYYRVQERVPFVSNSKAAEEPATQAIATQPSVVMSGSKSYSGGTVVAGAQIFQTVNPSAPVVIPSSKSAAVFTPTVVSAPTVIMTSSKSGAILSVVSGRPADSWFIKGSVVQPVTTIAPPLPPGWSLTPGSIAATTQPAGTVFQIGTLTLSPATAPATQP